MRKLFVGLLFLFIDYNIGSVSVTPGFVGYLLFWAGMGWSAPPSPGCGP